MKSTNPGATKLIAVVGVSCAALLLNCVPTFEGTVLRGYKDPIGIVTACSGHTGSVVLGKPYTRAECDKFLVDDLTTHAEAIKKCLTNVPTTYQLASFVSFGYNVGTSAFCHSRIAKKFNAGDIAGACVEMSKWVYAGKEKLPGLVNRRKIERAMCEGKIQ